MATAPARATVSRRLETVLAPARRALAPHVDPLVLKRYQTLARRQTANANLEGLHAATIQAFTRMAKQSQESGAYPRGFEKAVLEAFRGLAESDLDGNRPSPGVRTALVDQFHRLFYHSKQQTWDGTRFLGAKIWKNPLDLWLYQEMFHDLRPDVVIEAGTMWGGSAFYMASLFDLMGCGRVITIDTVVQKGRPEHARVTYLKGSSADPAIAAQVDALVEPGEKVMVILDSDHSRDHVAAELELWSSRVPVGSYLIVEDSNINGHPVAVGAGPGPMEALNAFVKRHPEFVVDESKHKFFVTFNPRGFLSRIR